MSGDPFQAEPSFAAARTAPRNPPLTDTPPTVVSEDESDGVLTSAARGRDARQGAKEARLRVVVVGQGPPTRGGIPSFISMLLEDPWLRGRVDLHHLNTTPARAKRPGAFALANITSAMSQGLAVFKWARRADVVHLNLAPVPLLPLIRAGVLVWAGRAAGCRVILHAHTGRLPAAVRSWEYRAVLRAVAGGADTLVVVSKEAEIAASR
ncbi:MAG: hypothetical protein M3P18_26905, partial [Actinomycetota bacterium]|nr:hypothetical protein [Actinomycetota bacterium]